MLNMLQARILVRASRYVVQHMDNPGVLEQ